ncbi:unnamed protein product [Fusarium graminearum]|nr:unnamed protein product [Fusarium graminearum]CAG1975073.1 unnamed protein product [Fusarium graminearum]
MSATPVVATPAGRTAPALVGGFFITLVYPGGGSARYRGGIMGIIGDAMLKEATPYKVRGDQRQEDI